MKLAACVSCAAAAAHAQAAQLLQADTGPFAVALHFTPAAWIKHIDLNNMPYHVVRSQLVRQQQRLLSVPAGAVAEPEAADEGTRADGA